MTYDPAYVKRWRLDRERGIRRYVPAEPVRAHVLALLGDGWSATGIAEVAGVSVQTVCSLRAGRHRQIRRATAVRLLAVGADRLRSRPSPTGLVPKVGAVRRIQALMALGWRHEDISQAMGAGRGRSAVVMHQRGEWIARATHDAVVRAYEALSMRPGPSEAVRERARRMGYVPPLAWDEDTIDDPAAEPVRVRRDPRPGGRRVDLDEWTHLVLGGESPERAASRLGVALHSVEQAARRHGREDVLDRIYQGRVA